jgi:hypothetical protein
MRIKTSNISCDIICGLPNPPMKILVSFDGEVILSERTTKSKYSISHDFDATDNGKSHIFNVNLSGKVDEHTIGDSTDSSQISIVNITLDGMSIDCALTRNDNIIKYTHDNNGYSDEVVVGFVDVMAFNGTIEMEFKTPLYLWVLENTASHNYLHENSRNH